MGHCFLDCRLRHGRVCTEEHGRSPANVRKARNFPLIVENNPILTCSGLDFPFYLMAPECRVWPMPCIHMVNIVSLSFVYFFDPPDLVRECPVSLYPRPLDTTVQVEKPLSVDWLLCTVFVYISFGCLQTACQDSRALNTDFVDSGEPILKAIPSSCASSCSSIS